jgi:hypothetical protein
MLGWIAIALTLVAASGCGDPGAGAHDDDPHPPGTDDERLLAARYAGFVHALEQKSRAGVCRDLEPALSRSFGCADGSRLHIPRELRGLDIPMSEVFAVKDPSVPEVIQISSEIRGDGRSLIVFFRRPRGADAWRVKDVMVGGYG